MIAIIDYGVGNLGSVAKAFTALGADVRITSSSRDLDSSEKIVLPGVGAFRDAMQSLRKMKIIPSLLKNIKAGKPYLGLCLGMQVLFEGSEEAPGVKGLGILKGKVVRFKRSTVHGPRSTVLKVPHMGWNTIVHGKSNCPLLKGIPDRAWMYFVHSYYVAPKDKSVVAAVTDYGVKFTSMVWKDNIYATQFHPEKSQKLGMAMLKNFVEL